MRNFRLYSLRSPFSHDLKYVLNKNISRKNIENTQLVYPHFSAAMMMHFTRTMHLQHQFLPVYRVNEEHYKYL